MMEERQVLIPFHRLEALTTKQAADLADRPERTVRLWCDQHGIGRKIGGQWRVSRVALQMQLEGDSLALARYHRGDRVSPHVVVYYHRTGIGGILNDAEFRAPK